MITSKSAAKRLLGLTTDTFTVQELRHAYFKMAKSTHPDMKKQFDDVDTVDDEAGAKAFLDVTRAYELLLGSDSVQNDNYCIPIEEEEEYRRACQLILGIDATIVEESKTNSMFLHWLMGNTDGAQHWRSFFAVHGGLAQKLRPPAGYIGQGGGDESSSPSRSKPRRQRPPRR
jgi:DnaJ-class molecular chaperone